jgi:hypothetical protein
VKNKKVLGFKAYNKGLVCNGFQYELGKTYKMDEARICEKGFHFCENPLDVLNYYDLTTSEFSEVVSTGKISKKKEKKADSKRATTEISIGAKLDLPLFIKASVDFLYKHCDKKNKKSGDSSKLASSGDSSQLASSGHYSKLASSGDSSKLEINGNNSVGANIGVNGIAKGKIGCWITLAEYKVENNKYVPVSVQSVQIDGKIIKKDVWYKLLNGKFTEQ